MRGIKAKPSYVARSPPDPAILRGVRIEFVWGFGKHQACLCGCCGPHCSLTIARLGLQRSPHRRDQRMVGHLAPRAPDHARVWPVCTTQTPCLITIKCERARALTTRFSTAAWPRHAVRAVAPLHTAPLGLFAQLLALPSAARQHTAVADALRGRHARL